VVSRLSVCVNIALTFRKFLVFIGLWDQDVLRLRRAWFVFLKTAGFHFGVLNFLSREKGVADASEVGEFFR